jgi:hypothetical protein
MTATDLQLLSKRRSAYAAHQSLYRSELELAVENAPFSCGHRSS